MAKTYEQIAQQIEALQQQADALRKKEAIGVIERIKEAIEFYGLTAGDLGFANGTSSAAPGKAATGTAARKAKSAAPKRGGKAPSAIRFRDGDGNSWTGMGRNRVADHRPGQRKDARRLRGQR